MTVRVRFAPSPTGYLHVGGARTALFNWLLARREGGTFILRIEDTDASRSTDAMTRGILDAMTWMGLDWDEGPVHQSRRLDRYREASARLVENGRAYYCFCSPEELAVRREARRAPGTEWKYDRACLALAPEEARQRVDSGEAAAVRFRVPEGSTRFEDAVFGPLEKSNLELEDFVLVRSTGRPTYQLGVVVDDIEMRMTHVVRGADHISNTPKQLLLYDALGAAPPVFAHVPLILGPDRSRLSKRHGATSVLAYRDQGVLPEAFINFLAMLGWSDGTDREIFDRTALINAFSLGGISKSNAVFDPDKLAWFSGQHINRLPVADLLVRLRPVMEGAGVWEDRFSDRDREWIERLVELIRPRFRSLVGLGAEVRVYSGDEVAYEEAAIARFLKDPKLFEYIPKLADMLERLDRFDLESTETAVRSLAGGLGVQAGLLINAARVALTGKAVAPGIFDVMVALGREKTVDRLRVLAGKVPRS